MRAVVIYYSRKGENYVNGSIRTLEEGNTAIAAKKIASLLGCDVFELESVRSYPSDYYACIEQAKQELKNDARPELKSIPDISAYDTVVLGYPNWWGTMPMCLFTFLEKTDLAGKRIFPFCTNEGSGLGSSLSDIRRLCPESTVGKGLSLHGSVVSGSEPSIRKWLISENLL